MGRVRAACKDLLSVLRDMAIPCLNAGVIDRRGPRMRIGTATAGAVALLAVATPQVFGATGQPLPNRTGVVVAWGDGEVSTFEIKGLSFSRLSSFCGATYFPPEVLIRSFFRSVI